MKTKFFLITFLLLFARGCDFYSTSLWFFDDPSGETNPLTRFLGFDFTGLLVSNAIIVGLIIVCFYYYSFRYVREKIYVRTRNIREFVSQLYFREKGKFHHIFYRTPKNKKALFAHLGYALPRVVIIASFLATIHNLCQFYQVAWYDTFREIVRRPLFVIYGLIILSLYYYTYRFWKSEYRHAMTDPSDLLMLPE